MTRIACLVLAGLFVGAAFQDDVVQLRDGSILVGKITKVDESGITIELKSGGKIDRPFAELMPYSVYRIKAARIDPASAAAHFELGDFCLANALFSYAMVEYDKAVELDASLADKVANKKAEVRNEEGRTRFEEAKRLVAERRFEEAAKLLHLLIDKFADTSYAAEARKEVAKVAEEIRKENEARQKDLDAKLKAKEADKQKKVEEGERGVVAQAVEAIEDAKKNWLEGLDWEAKGNLTKADRAFKVSEARLLGARKTVEVLQKSNDVEILKRSKDLDVESNAWLMRAYYRLGRMWATELNYTEALLWINKGLRIAPDDHLLNEILLTLTQLQMRKRASGSGY